MRRGIKTKKEDADVCVKRKSDRLSEGRGRSAESCYAPKTYYLSLLSRGGDILPSGGSLLSIIGGRPPPNIGGTIMPGSSGRPGKDGVMVLGMPRKE